MSEIYKELEEMYRQVKELIPFKPDVALVLGSGLGGFADLLKDVTFLPYGCIEGFPVSTVSGHAGRYVFGTLDGRKIVCMQGRVHLYEGYSPKQAVLPVRMMRMMGAKILILTNAAGGIGKTQCPGSFMCITDHISCFVPSPLSGENADELGTRFPDMSRVYDQKLCKGLHEAADAYGIKLNDGVYIQLNGPAYETPAEIRMCRTLGADAVGMSTVIEAAAARHAGMRVCGVSLITNYAAGIAPGELSHQEVKAAADAAGASFEILMKHFIKNLEL